MNRAHRSAFLIVALAFTAQIASAQVKTGTPPFGSFGGGPDVINLANLNSHITFPFLQRPGRGMDFGYAMSYDTSVWYPVGTSGSQTWQPVYNWGWRGQTEVIAGYISYTVTSHLPCFNNQHISYPQATRYDNWVYHDMFGAPHAFIGSTYHTQSPCTTTPPVGSFTNTATDGSGYVLNATSSTGVITATDGKSLKPPVLISFQAGTATDRNGNQITASSAGVFTDTLGSTVLTVSGAAPSNTTFTYTAPSGATPNYTMSYATYTVQTAFGCSGITEYSAANVPLVDRITLPDNTFYQFAYEPTPGSPTTVTGRLASVTFPSGVTISYQYSGGGTGVNGITCSDGSAATLTRIVPDGTWTYTRTMGSGVASATTITAPKLSYDTVANQTIVQFQGIYETQRDVYQGSAPAFSSLPIPESTLLTSNMLQEIQTCYNASASPCTPTAVALPITQRAVAAQFGPTGLQAKHVTSFNSSGLPTETDDYDYGSAVPMRKLLTTYATLGNGIIGAPASVTIQDGGGIPKAQTTYAYDETAVVAPPNQPTPQHTSITGSRGNVTTIDYPVSGLTAHFTYYDTGSVQTATDVNGAVTTYNYGALAATCGNTFPTGVAEPLSMSKSYTWNCTGGVQTQSTDENGESTTTSYTDANFWRPFSVTDPTSATTNLSYNAPTVSTPASVESSLLFNSNTSTVDVLTTSDGLGRSHVQQTRQAPGSSNFDSVETDYDAIGRPTRVTMPYQAVAGQTTIASTPGVKTTYDALGRILSVTDSGNGTTTYAYNQNDVLVTVGPAPTGENVKKRQLEYNALGWLTSVCEVTSLLPGFGSCAQTTAQTGYQTKYTYDTLGNVLSVTQNAQATSTNQQTRSYAYDAMSRLTSEMNPEMAQAAIAYTYDSDASGTCAGTYRNDLIKRVDPKGNTTCYSYDSLRRVISITYSGPYAPNTPNKYFVYDVATLNTTLPTTVQNAKTRLAEAYTATSQTGTKITDLGFSYTARGEVTDVYESTPHSNGYYHVPASYFANGVLNQLNTLSGGLPSLPGLPTFAYSIDGKGRVSTVSAGSGQNPVSNVTYNLYGSPPQLQLTFGSGDSDTYSYDANTGRMTQYKFTVGTSPQSVVGNLTWNQNGSLQQHQITDPFNAANTQICAYQHDDVSRIANVDCGTGGWGQSFAYDAFSNITKNVLQNRTGNSFQPTYQTSPSITNRIATLPGNITVNYDANGNTLTDGTYTYSWDVESRPTTIATSSTVSLTFDALGRAVEQLKNATYTQMVYGPAGGKLALMSGQTLQRAFVALPAGASAVYTASGLDHYQHSDWLGSARLTSTPSRTVSGDTAYAPFGETYAQSGTPDLSFTGQNQDTVGGLYDFLYREFSTQGRWHSPDPAGLTAVSFDDPQSLNRYAYARNMPDMLTDPLGLCPECRGGRDPLCMLERVEIACSLAFSLFQSGASMPCPSNNCTGVKFTAGSGGVDVLQQWVPYVSGSYIGTNGFTLATTTGYWSTIRGGGVMDAFWTIWGAYWDNVPYAGGIFIPIPQTGYTVSFMIPLARIPSTNTNCVGLGLAATTPTGKFVAGGPLLFGNLKNAKAILSGWGFNFGGQSTPFVGVQAVSNKSGSLGGPTLATSTGLSGGYGYSVCR